MARAAATVHRLIPINLRQKWLPTITDSATNNAQMASLAERRLVLPAFGNRRQTVSADNRSGRFCRGSGQESDLIEDGRAHPSIIGL